MDATDDTTPEDRATGPATDQVTDPAEPGTTPGATPGTTSDATLGATADTTSPARSRRLPGLVALVAVAVLAGDQVTKAVAVRELVEGERHAVLGDLLGVQLLYNPGAAFSLGSGYTVVFTVIMVVVIAVVVRSARRLGSRGWAWAFGLLVGGAAGNLVDRLVREPGVGRGEVVDFIAYAHWFIGNVADIAIVSAAVLIALLAVLGIGLDGVRERDQRA